MILPVVLQTGSVFAQLASANLAANGVLALIGGGREKNRKKLLINLQHGKR